MQLGTARTLSTAPSNGQGFAFDNVGATTPSALARNRDQGITRGVNNEDAGLFGNDSSSKVCE